MDKLFEEWQERHFKKGNDFFSRDGIVNNRVWEQQTTKRICFFLKEAHQRDYHIWSLTKWLRNENDGDGVIQKMWHTVAEFTYGLINTTTNSIPRYADAKALSESEKSALLQRIAIVNVKKSEGKSNSKWVDLIDYAKNDADLIRRELDIIDPDIIVCGNNSSLLRIVYGAEVDSRNKVLHNGRIDENLCNFLDENGYVWFEDKVIIDFWYPANQFPKKMNFYTLCCIYQKALEEKGK